MKMKALKKLSKKERKAHASLMKRRMRYTKRREKDIVEENEMLDLFRKKNKKLIHRIMKAWERNVEHGSSVMTISNVVSANKSLAGCFYSREAFDLFVIPTENPEEKKSMHFKNVAVRYFKLRHFHIKKRDENSIYFGREL